MENLNDYYRTIGVNHRKALRDRAARIVLGSSVIRVFKPDTKLDVQPILEKIPVDDILSVKNETEYRLWFERHLEKIFHALEIKNAHNPRVQPGLKWGHATKILCLFLREVVLSSRYFKDEYVERIEWLLYLPIDGINIKRLRSLGISISFNLIKEIDSPYEFYHLQEILHKTGQNNGVPRVWFDDSWISRV